MELIPYKKKMHCATRNIELGGAIAPNHRFLEKAFEVLEDGYFELVDVVYSGSSSYVDYIIRCSRCKQVYKVEERMSHYMWWEWQVLKE